MNTNNKLMEFIGAANMLDKTGVDTGAKKRAEGGGSAKGSGSSGSGFGSGSGGGGVSHVQATPSSLTISDCRFCEWLDGPGRARLDRGKPFTDLNSLFINHHSKYIYGYSKFVEMTVWRRGKVCFEVKVCAKFLDPSVKYDPAHSTSCQVMVDAKANNKAVWTSAMGASGSALFTRWTTNPS